MPKYLPGNTFRCTCIRFGALIINTLYKIAIVNFVKIEFVFRALCILYYLLRVERHFAHYNPLIFAGLAAAHIVWGLVYVSVEPLTSWSD